MLQESIALCCVAECRRIWRIWLVSSCEKDTPQPIAEGKYVLKKHSFLRSAFHLKIYQFMKYSNSIALPISFFTSIGINNLRIKLMEMRHGEDGRQDTTHPTYWIQIDRIISRASSIRFSTFSSFMEKIHNFHNLFFLFSANWKTI